MLTLGASPRRSVPVIRTVALGMVCLAGLGALAAAAKRPPLLEPAEVVFPIVGGSKADRLPLLPHLGKSIGVARVDVAYVPPVEDVAPIEAVSAARDANRPLPASFLGVGTIHITGTSSKAQSKEPVN
jgi:hypothetical protein